MDYSTRKIIFCFFVGISAPSSAGDFSTISVEKLERDFCSEPINIVKSEKLRGMKSLHIDASQNVVMELSEFSLFSTAIIDKNLKRTVPLHHSFIYMSNPNSEKYTTIYTYCGVKNKKLIIAGHHIFEGKEKNYKLNNKWSFDLNTK